MTLCDAIAYDMIGNDVDPDDVYSAVEHLESNVDTMDQVQYYMEVLCGQSPNYSLEENYTMEQSYPKYPHENIIQYNEHVFVWFDETGAASGAAQTLEQAIEELERYAKNL